MVYAEKKLPLRQIHQQGNEIVPAALNLEMVAFAQAIYAQVHFRPAGHANGDFLAQEEVWETAEGLRTINGVVVGDRNDEHALLFQPVIDLNWFIVGLPANQVESGGSKHPGCDGVDMEIAAHGPIVDFQYEQAVKRRRNLGECAHGTY